MLRAMAADLGITQYEIETPVQYGHRVLYFAIACWIKAASMDCPITGSMNTVSGISRRHVNDKCSAVLAEILKRYPYCRLWFDTGRTTENPIIILRGRLLRHSDLVNVGFNTNIALATPSRVQLTQNLECIKGSVLQANSAYVGVANVVLMPYNKDFIPEQVPFVGKWFGQYIKSAWWQQADLFDQGIEYFNPHKKSKNNHSCWQTTLPLPVENIVLIRRIINKNSYEYLLYKPNEHIIHRIDPLLQELGEHRRFMIGMRTISENSVPLQVIQYSDHIALKLKIYLPSRESVLLESYAWPHNNITDRLEWDMPYSVWEYIKPYMTGLGLEITEETYG